ncbi:SanA/YdcF family protein [Halomonas kashgarensis]|uniref:SanA/YdcF family protein n=1 Tax=Halomonas kashgarensis TaxID=3084920 RepID=UPI003A8D2904
MQPPVGRGITLVIRSLGAILLLAALLLVGANLWILGRTLPYIERDMGQCAAQEVGIVFGTSNWTRSGVRNPHFHGRMATAARLIEDDQLEHLLISGDNRTQAYNEPRAMWRELSRRGVAAEQMTMDFAGFSTFDTLARARDVFEVDSAMLITQDWHLPRAVYIGRVLGMEVNGCAAYERTVSSVWQLRMREWVARVATLGDLYLWGRKPYFLGPVEPLILPVVGPRALEPLEPSEAFEKSEAFEESDTFEQLELLQKPEPVRRLELFENGGEENSGEEDSDEEKGVEPDPGLSGMTNE